MPNYVNSAFNVPGDPLELKRFERTMFRPATEADNALPRSSRMFDFNGVIPMPAEDECTFYER